MVNSNLEESDINKYKDRKNNSIYNLSTDDLERMFNNVNYMIKERSRLVIEMLNSESAHSD